MDFPGRFLSERLGCGSSLRQLFCNARLGRPRREGTQNRTNQPRGFSVFLKEGRQVLPEEIPMTSFSRTILIALFSALLFANVAFAQQAAPAPTAPVPQAILDAKKIFVSNAGADSGLFPSPFTGDTNRGYNQLYAGLKANGQYELVGDPAAADLVLELQVKAPAGSTRDLTSNKVNGASDPVPMFRLLVYDRKTHYVLWALTQSIEIAYLQKTHDRNFDDALTAVLLEFESLSGKAQAVTH
jgi:hypothetical protein